VNFVNVQKEVIHGYDWQRLTLIETRVIRWVDLNGELSDVVMLMGAARLTVTDGDIDWK